MGTRLTVLVVAVAALLGTADLRPVPAQAAETETHRTDVIMLRAMPAERAAALYDKVLGTMAGTFVVPKPADHTIVVRDTPQRLARFRELLELLDQPGRDDARIYIRPVRHRAPAELADLARDVLPAQIDRGMTMVPDPATRHLIVSALPADYRTLDRLLRRLDVPARGGRDVRVTPGKAPPL